MAGATLALTLGLLVFLLIDTLLEAFEVAGNAARRVPGRRGGRTLTPP